MSAITLTGATLAGDLTNPETQQPLSGNNGSSGGHCEKKCCDNHGHNHGHNHGIPMMNSPSIEELLNSSTDDIVRALSNLLRFGRFETVQPILEKLVEHKSDDNEIGTILSKFDNGGHSLLHWAAKRVDDIRFLSTLVELVTKCNLTSILNSRSTDNVGMTPLHWACTESSIPHVALLWKKGADIESRDSSGCTPLLIAAQYGQVEVVAYLLKIGANIQAVDTSRDTALHWAAYKGSIQVCGLLAFYETLHFTTADAYGQTPLHLAALRGHTSVVRYILLQLTTEREREIMFEKDKNDRTPLDLAIHKNRPNVQVVLKDAMAKAADPRGHFFRKTMWSNLLELFSPKAWKQWMGMSVGADELDEPMKFPFFFLVGNFVLHFFFMFGIFAPILHAGQGILWDKSGWIFWNVVWMVLSWYFFYKTVTTPPGFLDDTHPHIGIWRRRYEETLEAYAEEGIGEDSKEKIEALPPLDHTSHVARPPRSKHCRISRKCVLLFDHYCPFVQNTVGLQNYKYFYIFLLAMGIGISSFVVTLITYIGRYRVEHGGIPVLTLMAGIEVSLCLLPVMGMCIYHTQLVAANLTTNEHINVRKYKYLYTTVNGRRQFRNPWNKGFLGNLMDRMSPSDASYLIASENQPLRGADKTIEMV